MDNSILSLLRLTGTRLVHIDIEIVRVKDLIRYLNVAIRRRSIRRSIFTVPANRVLVSSFMTQVLIIYKVTRLLVWSQSGKDARVIIYNPSFYFGSVGIVFLRSILNFYSIKIQLKLIHADGRPEIVSSSHNLCMSPSSLSEIVSRQQANSWALKSIGLTATNSNPLTNCIDTKTDSAESLVFITFAGRICEETGAYHLIELWKRNWGGAIPRNHILVMIGEIVEFAHISTNEAEQNGLEFPGLVDTSRLYDLLARSDLLVNPRISIHKNRKWNFPSKILLYLKFGIPILSSELNDDCCYLNKLVNIYYNDIELLDYLAKAGKRKYLVTPSISLIEKMNDKNRNVLTKFIYT